MPSGALKTFLIEFDNRQLSFTTNVAEVADFVAKTFRFMIVRQAGPSAGILQFLRAGTEHILVSSETHRYSESVPITELLPLVKDEVRLQFMRDRPDLFWLHGAAVARNGRAMILAGASGQGKSTLSTMLAREGWQFLSDDIAPIRKEFDSVIAFPQEPVRRLPVTDSVEPENLSLLSRETVKLLRHGIARGEAELGRIIFLEYSHGFGVDLSRLEQGSAALSFLRHCTNFYDHRATAVTRSVELARRLPMFKLTFGDLGAAKRSLEEVTHRHI